MSFIKGPVSGVFFKITAPASFSLDSIKDKLSGGFAPLGSLETETTGFVSSLLVNDKPSDDANCVVNDYLFCDFRRDSKKASSKLIKAELERKIREERNGKRFGRNDLKEEKELAKTKILAKTTPTISTYPVMVSQAQKLVVFGSASKKALELFVGCFQDLTGLSLERITAFTMARDWASSFKPDPDEDYVGKEDIDTAELPKLNSGDGNDLYQGLGCDFLSFLANRAVKQTSVPVGSDKWEVASYDKVEIASPADYKFKVSGNGTQDSGLLEQAVVDGGVVLSGFFELKDQDEQAWPLAFSAKTFGVGNLKLPQEKGEKNEAGARFVRGELVDEFFIALTGIFKAFMDTRVLATWSKLWTVKGKK